MILKQGAVCYQSWTAVKACHRSTAPHSHPANWTVSVIIITQERTGQRDRDAFCSGKIHSGCLVRRGKTHAQTWEHYRNYRLSYLQYCTEKQHKITGSRIEQDKSEQLQINSSTCFVLCLLNTSTSVFLPHKHVKLNILRTCLCALV